MNTKREKSISVRIDKELKTRIQLYCELNGISISELVRMYFLELMLPQKHC